MQDFATQIFHWADYQKAVRDQNLQPGRFVTPEVGEWISGLGLGYLKSLETNYTSSFHLLRLAIKLEQSIGRQCQVGSCGALPCHGQQGYQTKHQEFVLVLIC